jgi:hypothetical protein
MPQITTATQQMQVGKETTPGTAVACPTLLKCFDWSGVGIDAGISKYRPTGNMYDVTQELDYEASMLSLGGTMDFNGIIYVLAMIYGQVTPAAHGASSTAKDWIWTPSINQQTSVQTFTLMQGDSQRARKLAYAMLSDFGYKGDRKTAFGITGKGFGQIISDGITLTSSPAALATAQMQPKQFNVYLDTTSGGIGTTQVVAPISIDYSFGSVFSQAYYLNRTNASFTSHINVQPTTEFKMLLPADSYGLAQMQTYMESQQTLYVRVDAQGATIDTPNSIVNEFMHDMAVKVGKPAALADKAGIYAIEWPFNVVQDPAWGSGGTAQKITVTNLITAL